MTGYSAGVTGARHALGCADAACPTRSASGCFEFLERFLAAVVIGGFSYVPEHLSVEFGGERVDRGIHVGSLGVGVQGGPGRVDGSLGLVQVFLDVQHDFGVNDVVEMFLKASDFLRGIFAQGFGDFHLMTAYRDLHEVSPEMIRPATFAGWKAGYSSTRGISRPCAARH